jgi:Ca-activated chloride channel family protein
VPAGRPIVILAMDVSLSMCSTDIPPSRLQAAQAAALSFIRRHSPEAQIGIVAFAGSAELVQPPTTDQAALFSAVDSLTTAPATAIGSGILRSLDAIAEVNRTVAPGAEPAPAPGGVIVLLTDGESTTGPMPLRVAQQAVERGVRVHTIGFGTPDNQSITNCSAQIPEGLLDGGGQARLWHGLGIDEPMLRQIADMTGGTYYPAASQGELQNVFQNLPTYAGTRQETTEISVAFAALGALLAALAMLLALIWQPLG